MTGWSKKSPGRSWTPTTIGTHTQKATHGARDQLEDNIETLALELGICKLGRRDQATANTEEEAAHSDENTYTCTQSLTHICMHTRPHACKHTHTHTQTHTLL